MMMVTSVTVPEAYPGPISGAKTKDLRTGKDFLTSHKVTECELRSQGNALTLIKFT